MHPQTSEYGSQDEQLKRIVSTLHSLRTEEELTVFLTPAPHVVKQGLADLILQAQQSGEIKEKLRSLNDDKGLRDITMSKSGKTHGVHHSAKPAFLANEVVDPKLLDDSNHMMPEEHGSEHDITKVDYACEKPKLSYYDIIQIFLRKVRAIQEPGPGDPFAQTAPYPWPEPWANYVSCFVGIFIAIAIMAYVTLNTDTILFVGSFGASSVLYYATPTSALAQPKNAILGQVLGAMVALGFRNIITSIKLRWLCAALSVATTTVGIMIFHVLHPPGGATALVISTFNTLPLWNGFLYLLTPVLAGDFLMLALALIVNNVNPCRHYPDVWW